LCLFVVFFVAEVRNWANTIPLQSRSTTLHNTPTQTTHRHTQTHTDTSKEGNVKKGFRKIPTEEKKLYFPLTSSQEKISPLPQKNCAHRTIESLSISRSLSLSLSL